MKKFLFFAAVVCGFFAYTNPGMDDFSQFAHDRSAEIIEDEVGDSAIGRAVARAGSSLARDFADDVTDRKNYFVFSTYAVGDEPAWKFLGIAGRFVQLDGPRSSGREE